MSGRALALALLLLAAPVVQAKATRIVDAAGDGSPDLLGVSWDLETTDATLVLRADVPPGNGTEVRLFWARGTAGQANPEEWYVVSAAASGAAAAIAGHDGATLQADLNWTADGLVVRVPRSAISALPCTVFAAEAGTGSATGFTRSDTAPSMAGALESVWPVAGDCPDQATEAEQAVTGATKDSPAAALPLALLALAVVALARRR